MFLKYSLLIVRVGGGIETKYISAVGCIFLLYEKQAEAGVVPSLSLVK